MRYGLIALIPFGIVLAIFAILKFEHPPIDSTQLGFRGTGIVQVDNPRTEAALAKLNQPPESYGPTEPGGPLASEVYENVWVLGHLTEDEFLSYMASITEWVSPEQGCGYCHNEENLAEEGLYTKTVSRRMMQMTQTINADWGAHVGGAGVSCYTCHRGLNVPAYYFVDDDLQPEAGGFSASRNNQNFAANENVYSSLPYDALDKQLTQDDVLIRVQSDNALPYFGEDLVPIQDAETTYSLMMSMSQGLGVNCTYCHNTRAFSNWEQSHPARLVAWHGIEMAQHLNAEYLAPLASELPEHRLGPKGDAPKAKCATCHQGIPKPMYGADMVSDHPKALTQRAE